MNAMNTILKNMVKTSRHEYGWSMPNLAQKLANFILAIIRPTANDPHFGYFWLVPPVIDTSFLHLSDNANQRRVVGGGALSCAAR